MRLHKEAFDVLVQRRAEQLTGEFTQIGSVLLEKLVTMMKNQHHDLLEDITDMNEFQDFKSRILTATGTASQMTVSYLKDVSMMLAMVSAVREGDFYRHLQAERRMISLIFAFDHVNYARYNSYQHVYLTEVAKTNPRAFENLCVHAFGASSTGELFSLVHGDLVTEHFN